MTLLRPATPSDAALIADMSRETFYDTFAEYNTEENMQQFLSERFSREQLMDEVGRPGNLFLLAFSGEEPAGYVFLKDESHPQIPGDNALEISRLYVRRPFIGKGVGKQLMQAAVHHALETHKTFVWLAVWEHNQRAIDFYHSFGFEKFSEHDFILGKDVQNDWLMRLKITS